MTYTQAKECIKALGKEGLRDLIDSLDEDIVIAGLNCDISPENIEEAYNGQHNSDEDFTQELLESCGDIPKDLPIYVHIDWEATARDIMLDYCVDNGYYFRIF